MTQTGSALSLEVGDEVVTPSGAIAKVIEVFDGIGEALVQWGAGDQAQFRLAHLKRVYKTGGKRP